jgi:hypothetical protein
MIGQRIGQRTFLDSLRSPPIGIPGNDRPQLVDGSPRSTFRPDRAIAPSPRE